MIRPTMTSNVPPPISPKISHARRGSLMADSDRADRELSGAVSAFADGSSVSTEDKPTHGESPSADGDSGSRWVSACGDRADVGLVAAGAVGDVGLTGEGGPAAATRRGGAAGAVFDDAGVAGFGVRTAGAGNFCFDDIPCNALGTVGGTVLTMAVSVGCSASPAPAAAGLR